MSIEAILASGGAIVFTIAIIAVSVVSAIVPMAITGVVIFFVFKKLSSAGSPSLTDAVSAPATIVSAGETGLTVNKSPQLQLQLRVHAETGDFDAVVRPIVPRVQLAQYAPGSLIHVRYERTDATRVAIERLIGAIEVRPVNGGERPDALPLVRRLIASQELQEALESTPTTPATVVAARELGLYVQGGLPFTEVLVEVAPPGGAPFAATAAAVIGPIAMDKYREGKAVIVRVNPSDPTVVALAGAA